MRATSLGQASAAVRWAAQGAGRSDPCKDRLVTSIIGLVRRKGDEVCRVQAGTKEPLLFLHKWAEERKTFVAHRKFHHCVVLDQHVC